MKVVIVLTLVTVAALAHAKEIYDDSRFENFDVDGFVSNERLLKGFIQCFLGKGNCTPEGKDFKKALPELVETSCGKCTAKQRAIVRKMMLAMKEKSPEEWAELVAIHDPEHKRSAELQKFLSES